MTLSAVFFVGGNKIKRKKRMNMPNARSESLALDMITVIYTVVLRKGVVFRPIYRHLSSRAPCATGSQNTSQETGKS